MKLEPFTNYQFSPKPGVGALESLLLPYALLVSVDGVLLQFGRFSLGLLKRIRLNARAGEGLVFRCGAFCQSAASMILVGGDHDNDSLWNIAFANGDPVFSTFSTNEGLLPTRSTLLGDNVLISAGAIVLGGAQIGDGAVVGAGAVVRNCEPFGVYVGAPARKLRDRFSPEMANLYRQARLPEVHAHHLPYLADLLNRLAQGKLDLDHYFKSVTLLTSRPMLHFEAYNTPAGVRLARLTGATIDGAPVQAGLFEALGAYVSQDLEKPFNWSPDVFHARGLC